jgi:hypothetical protein
VVPALQGQAVMEIWNVNIFYQFVGKGGLAGDGVQVPGE